MNRLAPELELPTHDHRGAGDRVRDLFRRRARRSIGSGTHRRVCPRPTLALEGEVAVPEVLRLASRATPVHRRARATSGLRPVEAWCAIPRWSARRPVDPRGRLAEVRLRPNNRGRARAAGEARGRSASIHVLFRGGRAPLSRPLRDRGGLIDQQWARAAEISRTISDARWPSS